MVSHSFNLFHFDLGNLMRGLATFIIFHYFHILSTRVSLKINGGMWLIVYDQVLYYTMCYPKTMKILKNNKSR